MITDIAYNLVVNGQKIAELNTAYNKTFGEKQKDISMATFAINLKNLPDIIAENLKTGSELWISLKGFDEFGNFFNNTVWIGKIYVGGKNSAVDTGTIVECKAICYYNELRYRNITKDYTLSGLTEGEVVWDMIETTQTDTTINGTATGINQSWIDLGIKKGTVESTLPVRSIAYVKDEIYKNIQTFVELSDGGNFVFYPNITNSNPFDSTQNLKVFNYYKEAGEFINTKYSIEIQNVDVQFDTEIYNYIIFYGNGVNAVAYDAQSIQNYGLKTKIESDTAITDVVIAQSKADGILAIYKDPRTSYKITVQSSLGDGKFGTYSVNDSIWFVYKDKDLEINEYIQIKEMNISIDENKLLNIDLLLSNQKIPLRKSRDPQRVIAYTIRQNTSNVNNIAKN
jgi:hypothetical protein